MLNKRYSTLLKVNCRPFASEVVFWAILKYFWVRCLLKDKGGINFFERLQGPELAVEENQNLAVFERSKCVARFTRAN